MAQGRFNVGSAGPMHMGEGKNILPSTCCYRYYCNEGGAVAGLESPELSKFSYLK